MPLRGSLAWKRSTMWLKSPKRSRSTLLRYSVRSGYSRIRVSCAVISRTLVLLRHRVVLGLQSVTVSRTQILRLRAVGTPSRTKHRVNEFSKRNYSEGGTILPKIRDNSSWAVFRGRIGSS